MSFSSYDGWLESPYDEGRNCSESYCSLCWSECEDCDTQGELDGVTCSKCEGEGAFYAEQASESEHRYEYDADQTPDDK